MQKKIALYLSFLIILIPLIKFDIFVYPTLDYFGKYVFVLTLNIMPFWIAVMFFNLKNEKLKIFLTLLWAVFIGTIFYLIS